MTEQQQEAVASGSGTKLRRLIKFVKKAFQSEPPVEVCDDVLEMIFIKMDLDERMRMGLVSRRTLNVVENMPLILPLVMIRSDIRGNFELYSDNLDLIAGFILDECPGYRICGGDRIVFSDHHSHIVMNRILSKISGISQLWLDCSNNGRIAQLICDFYRELNQESTIRKFIIEQLTVIGKSGIHCDIEPLAQLIMLSRRSLEAIRFRNSKINDENEAVLFWSSVSQCFSLRQMQYEPIRVDRWSRSHIVNALTGKQLTSLIMTGVNDITTSDIVKIASKGTVTELAVVSEEITTRSYQSTKAKQLINGLGSLLIQLDAAFSIEEDKTRKHILNILKNLPEVGVLEVIHVSHGSIADLCRTLSYWLRLAKETTRVIKLKLEDCSQERQDAAVGRLMRKSRDSNKIEWGPHGLSLSCGVGKVVLLDKQTWFGDEE